MKTLKEVLNPRQFRIVELVGDGCRNRDIAEALGTTEQVVKNNLHAIFDVAGCWSRHELAMRFIRERNESGVQTDLNLSQL